MEIKIKQKNKDNFDHEPWNKFQKEIFSSANKVVNIKEDYYGIINTYKYQVDISYFEEKFDFPLNKIFDIARDGKYSHIIFVTNRVGFNQQCFSYAYSEIANRNIGNLFASLIQVEDKPYSAKEFARLCLNDPEFTNYFDFNQTNKILILINENLIKFFENEQDRKLFAGQFLTEVHKEKNEKISPELQKDLKQYKKDLEQAYKKLDKDLLVDYMLEVYCNNDDYTYALSEACSLEDSLNRYSFKELKRPADDLKCYKKFDTISISSYTEEKLAEMINDEIYFYINTASGDFTVFSFPNTFIQEKDIPERTDVEQEKIEEFKQKEKQYHDKLNAKMISLFKEKKKNMPKMSDVEQFNKAFDRNYEAEFLYGKEFRKKYDLLTKKYDISLPLKPDNWISGTFN